MNRQTIRQRELLFRYDGIMRFANDDIPPWLEPEETDRWILTVPPLPVGMERPLRLRWWLLAACLAALAWWLS